MKTNKKQIRKELKKVSKLVSKLTKKKIKNNIDNFSTLHQGIVDIKTVVKFILKQKKQVVNQVVTESVEQN
jgi:hypothetical protein